MDNSDGGKRSRSRRNRRRQHTAFNTIIPRQTPAGFRPDNSVAKAGDSNVDSHVAVQQSGNSTIAHPILPNLISIQQRLQRLLASIETENKEEFQPLLIAKPNMSTLGSQARAAELAAATAARSRQISREIEEQKLPPKPRAIPLSLLVKGQTVTRNKGTKTFRPLNLEELGGEEADGELIQETNNMLGQRHGVDNTAVDQSRQLYDHGRSSSTANDHINVPTGPRSMVSHQIRPPLFTSPAPVLMHPHPIVNFPPVQTQPPVCVTPFSEYNSGYPYQGPVMLAYLHPFPLLGAPQDTPEPKNANSNTVSFDEDVSPTKQEEELAEFVRKRQKELTNIHSIHRNLSLLSDGLVKVDPAYEQVFHPAPSASTSQNKNPITPESKNGDFQSRTIHPKPALTIDTSGKSQRTEAPHNIQPPPMLLAHTLRELRDIPQAMKTSQVLSQSQSNHFTTTDGPSQFSLILPNYDEPYDRGRMMQQCKETLTQEAMARKGKTVLHNPELHKAKLLDMPMAQDKEKIQHDNAKPTVLLPPPGLEYRANIFRSIDREKRSAEAGLKMGQQQQEDPFKQTKHKLNGPHSDMGSQVFDTPTNLRKEDDDRTNSTCPNDNHVSDLPSDFFNIGPVTHIERQRVRSCMTKVAAEFTNVISRPVDSKMDSKNIKQECVDYRQPILHTEDSTIKHWTDTSSSFGLSLDEMGHNASADIIGKVALNFKFYFDQMKLTDVNRSIFPQVKAVPAYAIDTAVLMGVADRTEVSFLGQDTQFVQAPNRINRDPRYRPETDWRRAKLEEEWKHGEGGFGRKAER